MDTLIPGLEYNIAKCNSNTINGKDLSNEGREGSLDCVPSLLPNMPTWKVIWSLSGPDICSASPTELTPQPLNRPLSSLYDSSSMYVIKICVFFHPQLIPTKNIISPTAHMPARSCFHLSSICPTVVSKSPLAGTWLGAEHTVSSS